MTSEAPVILSDMRQFFFKLDCRNIFVLSKVSPKMDFLNYIRGL